jgi:hypothetical protein
VYAATRTGVWRSLDGGATWVRRLNSNGTGGTNGTLVNTQSGYGGGMIDLAIRTDTTSDALIASSGNFVADGIYRSINGGDTWARVHTAASIGRTSLAIAPSDQQVMYALAATNNTYRLLNVYRSVDGGATWTPRVAGTYSRTNRNWLLLTNPIIATIDTCVPGYTPDEYHQGWYDNTIAVAPHNPDIVFAGGIDMFRSVDGGANWDVISYWWTAPAIETNHADHHAIVFHPQWNGTSQKTMFTGNDGGVYRTSDALATTGSGTLGGICYDPPGVKSSVAWTPLNNGYNVTQFYHGAAFPSQTKYLGGTQDNGTPKGSDAGGINSWADITGGDGGFVAVNPSNANIVFTEYTGDSLQRALDGGVADTSFEYIGWGIVSDPYFPFIAPYKMDPQNPDRIWIGGAKPWRSNNACSALTGTDVTWTQAGAALSGTVPISAWEVQPNNSNVVYAGTETGLIFKTVSGTTSTASTVWTAMSTGLPSGGYITGIAVDPSDPSGNTVYATQSVYGKNKVFKTTNGAAPWTNISGNLPDIPTHCVAIQPGAPKNIFIGTDLGVFLSKTGGGSWVSLNATGFSNAPVYALQFQGPGTLYAFTHGRGAWRATVDTTLPPDLASVTTDTLTTPANWQEYLREPNAGDPSFGGLTSVDHDAANSALRARVSSDPGTAGLPLFRAAGWRTTDAYALASLPYAAVGPDNFVRSKFFVYATGNSPAQSNTIPATRMQVYNRFVVITTLEVFTHLNDGANNAVTITGDELGAEIAPSTIPTSPSLYRVDYDPVDTPYLVSNGATEGIARAFLAQGDRPQDNGFICLTESVTGVYPAAFAAGAPAKVYATSASDAGDLKVTGVTPAGGVGGPSVLKFTYPFGASGRIQTPDFSVFPSVTEGTAGVTLDTTAYDNLPDVNGNPTRAGIALVGFYPGDDLTKRVRVEPAKQYKVRFHVTSTQQSNLQPQLRLQVNVGGGVWVQKYEVGGARTGSAAAQAIAGQALPGVSTQNPDRFALETQGCWYTLLMHTPLSKAVRPDLAGTLASRMPNWFTFAGPGVNDLASVYGGASGVPGALNRRDLRAFAAVLDTFSYLNNAGVLEKANFTVDRIEVTVADLVDDGNPEALP